MVTLILIGSFWFPHMSSSLFYLIYSSYVVILLLFDRLADSSANPKAATAAAKAYFVDLNDMTEWAVKKNGVVITEAYKQSLTDLAAFRKAL